jgi:beta-glucanase (GH16 family)
VWSDEFDAPANTPLDPQFWTHDVGGDGWGNEQLEFDTDRIENVRHDGEGHLAIVARRESYQGREYTSARIKTQGLFTTQYGRVEARIKLPKGQGLWPAFWMLGQNFPTVGWPQCGEIDIMEFRGQNVTESTGAVHGPGFSAGQSIWGAQRSAGDLTEDFHVYAVERSRSSIVWSVDGEVFHRVSPEQVAQWPFDQPFFLILNVAVGGTYVGAPNAATQFPQTMLVDWVRVYE